MDCEPTGYDLMKVDSELLLKLIDKHVKVNLIKNSSYVGFVHSIDPITNSMILSIPQDDTSYQTILIPGHAILEVTEEEICGDIKPPQRITKQIDSKEDTLRRKNILLAWFKSNLLPVSESDGIITIGCVSLLPPYNISDICTDNPIVAMQIKKIMERLPDDFEL